MTKSRKNTSFNNTQPKPPPQRQTRTRTRRKRSDDNSQPTSAKNEIDAPDIGVRDDGREVLHDGDGIPLLAPAGSDVGGKPSSNHITENDSNDDSDGNVGYKNPPRGHQFKKGQSGNPSGRRKKPKLPRHLGNQSDAISIALVRELNNIMMHGMPGGAPTGPYNGARMLARIVFRDAMTKDGGYARKRLLELYYDDKRHLDEFKPKDREELEMDRIHEQFKLMSDPRTTDADITRAIKRWEDEEDL